MGLGWGAYGACPREAVERVRPSLVLAHENPSCAEAARAANPNAYIGLRADDGKDEEQPSGGDPAGHARWWVENKVKPKLARARPGTYNWVTAYNEAMPGDDAGHAFRGALEYETCKLVQAPVAQGGLGLDYACIAQSVGNIESWHLRHYLNVIKTARCVNVHGYLGPGRTSVSEETDPYYLWRPLLLWWPDLRRLGVPLRLLLGECGTYSPPEETGISRGDMLRLCTDIDEAMAARCLSRGVEYLGAVPFGFGTVGEVMEKWNLLGNEGAVNWAWPLPAAVGREVVSVAPTTAAPKLWLAVLPSNQDQNPVLGGGNEQGQMAKFAAQVLSVARRYSAVTVKVFTGKPESQDGYRFAGLRGQLAAAYAWLQMAPAGTLTVSLNLHSDSGTESHVGYYYDGATDVSRRLARVLGEVLGRCFGTTSVLSADYGAQGYLFVGEMKGRHCPVLLECGSHQNARDVARLQGQGEQIAGYLVDTLLGFFGLSTELAPAVAPALNWQEVGEYGRWAVARAASREEPRDLPAFQVHLRALGADASMPWRYGYPVKV